MTGGRRDKGKKSLGRSDKGKRLVNDIRRYTSARQASQGATNKQNRASDCDGQRYIKHVGGSITNLTHRDRLNEKIGHEPSIAEGFMQMHSRLNSKGEREWSNDSAHSRHDAYVERYEPPSSKDSTSAPLPPPSTQIDRWTDMIGGPKKGRVSSLTGLASHRTHRSTTNEMSQREQQLQTELTAVKEELTGMKGQLAHMTSRMSALESQMEAMRQLVRTLQQQPAFGNTSFPPRMAKFPSPTTVAPSTYARTSRQHQGTTSSTRLPFNPRPSVHEVHTDSEDDDIV